MYTNKEQWVTIPKNEAKVRCAIVGCTLYADSIYLSDGSGLFVGVMAAQPFCASHARQMQTGGGGLLHIKRMIDYGD